MMNFKKCFSDSAILCLPKPVYDTRMLYSEITFCVLFLNNVFNEALWQTKSFILSLSVHKHKLRSLLHGQEVGEVTVYSS